MKASVLLKEVLQLIIENESDLDVDISTEIQLKDTKQERQECLRTKASCVILETYEREQKPYGTEKRITIKSKVKK